MATNPVITVLVPLSNEPPGLFRKVLDSLQQQTWREMDIIIIDDGSKNPALQKVIKEKTQDTRFRCFRRERKDDTRTCSEAYNLGLDNVQGDWVDHNAADDYYDLEWAERLVKFMKGREDEINGICVNWEKHNYDGSTEVVDMKANWDWSKSSLENYVQRESIGGCICKWDWIKNLRFDTRFPRKQTREYRIRVLKQGDIEHYPKFLWHFTQWKDDHQRNYASIHWRILADLMNGIYDYNNLGWGMNMSAKGIDKFLYYSAIHAYMEFATEPKWKKDYDKSEFKKEFARIKDVFIQEAKEKYDDT